ncbi:MAG: LEPR-XLL domain-containing protein, partial [Pedobacter sp.]
MSSAQSVTALKPGKANNNFPRASRGSLFRLECLEPRLLLSADPLLGGTLQDLLLKSLQDASIQDQNGVVQEILQDNSTYWQKDASIVAKSVVAPVSPDIDVSNVSSLEPLNPVNTVGNAVGVDIDVAADLQLASALQSSGGDLTITPTDRNGTIVLGSDVNQSGRSGEAMFISNSEIALMQDGFSRIVIGGVDGSYSVQIGDSARSTNEAVTFTDNLVINAPSPGGEVYIYNTLQTTGDSSITINGSGHTTHLIGAAATPPAPIVSSGSNVTFDDSVKVSGTALVTAGTYIQVGASSAHSLNGDSTDSNNPDKLILQAGTNISVMGRVGDVDPLEAFYIAKSGTDAIYGTDDDLAGAVNVTFDSEVKVDGDFIINATGVVSFKKSVVVTNGNLKISGATQIIFEDSVSVVGGGYIFLEGNEVDFKTGTTSVMGTGSLTIRPSNKATNIEIADPAYPTDCLNLTLAEVKSFASTFSGGVTIGWQDAGTGHTTAGTTGTVRIGADNGEIGTPTFTNKTAVFGSSIQINDYSVSNNTLLSYKDLTLDALGAIDIENKIKIFDGTNYSDLTLFSLNGKISQLDNSVDALIKEPVYARNLIVTAANGINLGWVDVDTVNMQNTGASGNIFVNVIAAGGDVTVSKMAQTSGVGSGSIILTTENGKITVASTGSGVSAAGTGNILISSGETVEGTATNSDITVSKDITGGGNISIISKDNIIQTAITGDISATNIGTIDLKADDAIIMGDGALTQSNNGNIRYEATAGNITIGELSTGVAATTTGSIGIFATNGSILDLDTDTSTVDITTRNLILSAKGAIGASANFLEAAVVNLSTKSTSSSTFIAESDSVTVTALTLAVQRVQGVPNPLFPGISDVTTGTVIATPDDVQENLWSGADLALVTTNGFITVNGGSTATTGIVTVGNILLSSGKTSANADITLNASVTSSTGNISIISKDSIIQAAAGDIGTTTSGKTIDLKADVAITMSDGALTQTLNGNIRYEATAGDITLGELNAGTAWAAVIATVGSILDLATDSSAVDVTANNLILFAGTAIGESTNHLETKVVSISAKSVSGSTFITESDSVTVTNLSVTVNRFNSDGTTTTTTAYTQEDLVSAADLVFVTTNGFITVGGGATSPTTGINAVGNILLSAGETVEGTVADITLNASVISSGNNISLYSRDSIIQVAAGDISVTSADKTIDLKADDSIVMFDGALTQTTNCTIRYEATSGNITLGALNAGSGCVSIIATVGSILDLDVSDTSLVDIIADNLILTAGTAIGQSSDHLETTVANLSTKSTSGGTFVAESDGVTVTNLSVIVNRVDSFGTSTATAADLQEDLASGADLVLITTTGGITVGGGATTSANGINAAGNILVNAIAGSIDVQTGVTSSTGNISAIADATLFQSADVSDIT